MEALWYNGFKGGESRMEWKDWITLIGIILTFGLGLFNLYQTIKLKRKTHFVDTITAERIKWLEKLRGDISRFSGLTSFWTKSLKGIDDEYSRDVLKEIDILRIMIKLRLNPNGKYDKEIITLVDDIPKITDNVDMTELNNKLDELTSASQKLLKEEWDRVRKEVQKGKESRILNI